MTQSGREVNSFEIIVLEGFMFNIKVVKKSRTFQGNRGWKGRASKVNGD